MQIRWPQESFTETKNLFIKSVLTRNGTEVTDKHIKTNNKIRTEK